MNERVSELGNVLFLILIAVVLFAALSYAVTRSGTNSGALDKDRAVVAAATVAQYAGLMEQSVKRLMLVNNCSDTEISVENSWVSGYNNPNSPSDKSCHVFDPAGGGINSITPPKDANNGDNWFFRVARVHKVGKLKNFCHEPPDEPCYELLALLGNLNEQVCLELNKKIDGLNLIPEQDNGKDYELTPSFDGNYKVGNRADIDGHYAMGKTSLCIKAADGEYVFYRVLIAR